MDVHFQRDYYSKQECEGRWLVCTTLFKYSNPLWVKIQHTCTFVTNGKWFRLVLRLPSDNRVDNRVDRPRLFLLNDGTWKLEQLV